ncbi:hypothetical protein K08M3_40600 [Vibrio alginolyticus]|uniref:TniQ domain-containing protein n=1 Tax=Vibrio alginolyticus TaxID=663 RepID=A0A1W6V6N3_VIBAL|nr:TniQ family protein [Vibrio alginolyticus]ARP00900.1 hypothetical protein K01M1_40750 [Vibrio alginolyticus]ARP05600.1 hypothetical protein K04M1_40680 [Vibrio alginolyticus]ARP10658.1 hypothetical protein K04M3_40700 [Vibrio alginolyticus]ARP15757.1 hypothetical protein K04M5_40960 [Vibrio alginolyticus]ARP20811.1 hypothetical protein K05K4_40910 [Vibrio alginolyticus]
MIRRLPCRPRPQLGESLAGYTTRLASVNCWTSAKGLAKDMCCKPFAILLRNSDKLRQELDSLTGHSDELYVCDTRHPLLLRDNERSFKYVTLLKPRICPDCISEHGIHYAVWQIAGLGYCEKHQYKLIHRCPACLHDLEWNEALLENKCDKCGEKFRGLQQRLPDYIYRLGALAKSKRIDAYADLLLAAQRGLRPFDSIFDEKEHIPESIDWEDALTFGYRLLTEPYYAQSWLNQLTKERAAVASLSQSAVFLPFDNLISHLRLHWPINDLKTTSGLSEVQSYMNSELQNYPFNQLRKHTNDLKCFRYHTNTHGLLEAVGGNVSATDLVDIGLAATLNLTRVSSNSLYSLDQVADKLAKMTTKTYIGDTICRREYLPLMKHFYVHDIDILQAILDGKMPGTIEHVGSFFDSFRPAKFSLLRLCIRCLKSIKNMDILATEAQSILGVSKAELSVLIKSGLVHVVPHQKVFRVSGSSVLQTLVSKNNKV